VAASVLHGRASRYFESRPARSAKIVTTRELALLRGLADLGDAGRLVLQFGPHRGATPGQMVRDDPAYVRHLASQGRRPNVRAAALRLVSLLESVEAGSAKRQKAMRRSGSQSSQR
jgi:hypothetical protein